MKRARLIYNPVAGRGLVVRMLPKLLDCLERAGFETSAFATSGHWSAANEARRAAEAGFDTVIAAGGDGTIHEVVNGLAGFESPPRLGILPAGTTNDLARALGIPRDLVRACQAVVNGRTVKMDVGRSQDRYFINVAAVGRMAEVSYEAPIRWKARFGPLAYYAKALEKVGQLSRPFPVRIETGDRTWEEEILLMVAANSGSVGGFRRLAPEARVDDGLMDVLVVPAARFGDLVQLVSLAVQGKHLDDPRLIYFRTDRLKVDTPEPLALNLDGEWGGERAGQLEMIPRRLEIYRM
ncbi:YegS/Rv2252/BmrU family lipid kinase [Staphylospora marina]|uniref:YegS/Rv2252/BmrU family lipid kinase n=1 Tax=Staphylospora marina TaxID=2490858 RepID=UPI000F5C07FB|nr:YegS/Rv2252/BmrU family lipid kinase [Staphylospora marina]